MTRAAQETYLTAEVMTATPQKLQLMLTETAMRLIERTRQSWRAGEDAQACESVIRAQEIIVQMLSSLNPEVDRALVKKVADVYLFVHRALMEAATFRDEKKLDDAQRVLAIERETWRRVCEMGQSASSGSAIAAADWHPAAIGQSPLATPVFPAVSPTPAAGEAEAGTFSWEA